MIRCQLIIDIFLTGDAFRTCPVSILPSAERYFYRLGASFCALRAQNEAQKMESTLLPQAEMRYSVFVHLRVPWEPAQNLALLIQLGVQQRPQRAAEAIEERGLARDQAASQVADR